MPDPRAAAARREGYERLRWGLVRSQSLEFIFQPELFLFQFRDLHFIPCQLGQFRVYKLLYFLVFFRNTLNMRLLRLCGHRSPSCVEGDKIRSLPGVCHAYFDPNFVQNIKLPGCRIVGEFLTRKRDNTVPHKAMKL